MDDGMSIRALEQSDPVEDPVEEVKRLNHELWLSQLKVSRWIEMYDKLLQQHRGSA